MYKYLLISVRRKAQLLENTVLHIEGTSVFSPVFWRQTSLQANVCFMFSSGEKCLYMASLGI